MSDESVDIKINLKGVTSDVEQKLNDIGNKAKKGIPVSIDPRSRTQPINPISKPVQSARSQSNNRGLINNTKESVYSGKNQGARAASSFQSDIDEGASGGFYNSLSNKFDSLKGLMRNPFPEINQPNNNSKNNTPNLHGSGIESAKSKLDKAEFTIQNADFKKIANAKNGGGFGAGNFAGGGNGGGHGGTFATGGESGRGSIASKAFAGIPIVGAAIAGITAGLLKLVSDVGQRHVQAVMSQSSTFSATGGYVSGGGGLFANADVAQAHIARGRVTGQSVYGKDRGKIDDQEMKFAASQGRGLSEVVETMAKLRKENSMGLNYYRGAANQAGFKNLRQTEFITKIADMSSSLRQQGFSGNMESMLSSVVGMRLGENSDPMRKIGIAESIGDKTRSGIFGGGVTGALAMSEALKESGGDFNKAMALLEGKDGVKYGMQGLNNVSESARAFLFKKEGHGTYTEGLTAKLQQGQVQEDTSEIKATPMRPLEMQNQINSTFANSGGAASAAEVGFTMTKQLLSMYETLEGTIGTVTKTLHSLEEGALKGIGSALTVIAPTLEKLASGDIDGIIDPLVKKLKENISIFGD